MTLSNDMRISLALDAVEICEALLTDDDTSTIVSDSVYDAVSTAVVFLQRIVNSEKETDD